MRALVLFVLLGACGPKPGPAVPQPVPADAGVADAVVEAAVPVDAAPDVAPAGPNDPVPPREHQLALGGEVSCSLSPEGQVHCWGSNRFGELGVGLEMGARSRRESAAPVAGIEARAIAVGTWHLCALDADGAIRCWGHNAWGQLGDGTNEDRNSPVVADVRGAVQISAGLGHTCARHSDRTASCWGRNQHGQLGDGSFDERTAPVAVPLEGVVEIRAGRAHTCARLEDGTVWCWGENVDGQLGDGTRSTPSGHRPEPVQVAGIEDARAIRVGGGASCAILGDERTVSCWGRNDSFQLVARPGGRAHASLLDATPVPELRGVDDLGLGSRFMCVRAAGQIRCVGLNHRGQLGDGSRRLRRELTEVDLSDVIDLGVGAEHACARTDVASCWGANRRGQLGDGTIRFKPDPVVVSGMPQPATPDPAAVPLGASDGEPVEATDPGE